MRHRTHQATIARILTEAGYAVDIASTGSEAISKCREGTYAAVTIDILLPDMSGLDVLKALRNRGDDLPVMIITARDAVTDRVSGLDAGADDYVVKPFDLAELAARIRALLRRRGGRAGNLIEHLGVALDLSTRTVTRDGAPVELSAREFALLHALMEHPGRILSKAQLEERLYGWGEEVESNAVEVHVHNLRKKLGNETIRTLRGIGYALS